VIGLTFLDSDFPFEALDATILYATITICSMRERITVKMILLDGQPAGRKTKGGCSTFSIGDNFDTTMLRICNNSDESTANLCPQQDSQAFWNDDDREHISKRHKIRLIRHSKVSATR
jgi:hypothetical protein